jgi:hypothetical protein
MHTYPYKRSPSTIWNMLPKILHAIDIILGMHTWSECFVFSVSQHVAICESGSSSSTPGQVVAPHMHALYTNGMQ